MATVTARLQHKVKKSSKKPLRWLRKTAFAEKPMTSGQFGDRELFPCDYAASGGVLKLIEKYVQETIEPFLDKETVLAQKTLADLREEARGYIHKATNCSEDHVVVFTENGFQDAFSCYLNALDVLKLSMHSNRAPVVFVGHDIWTMLNPVVRKFGADPMEIQMSPQGYYDGKQLDTFLKFYKRQGRVLVGVFSVGDEITGTFQDTKTITGILHSYGALSLWDYTTSGAFTKIDMCPLLSYEGLTNKDAAFIQTDRFLGGEGSSSVLITNGSILRNPIFETVQEGILAFCTVDGQLTRSNSPHSSLEQMENAYYRRQLVANPLKAKSVFELKGYFGDCFLQKKTAEISELLTGALVHIPSIHLVGEPLPQHPLPYFSLFFSHVQTEWALHPGFILMLLTDLFGIVAQSAPITLRHLPLSPKLEYQRLIHDLLFNSPPDQTLYQGIMKAQCVHLSLMHYMRDVDIDYLFAAIRLIAEEGWRLLPLYRFDVETGTWFANKPMSQKPEVLSRTISKIRSIQVATQNMKFRHMTYIERAKKAILSVTSKSLKKLDREGYPAQGDEDLSPIAKKHRWFMTPAEAKDLLDDGSPVRLSGKLEPAANKKQGRSWPAGIVVTTPKSPSERIAHASYKRRFRHA